ncbi:MAG: 16S rRNA (adenine(1518)-N(6)/adenine(1519)-N(6))-dimethyltransferase RsmA [Candidatus Dormibacteraceae bacterium]
MPKPIKRLGQNFLVEPMLRDRILNASGVNPEDEVLEIGAGEGVLTAGLITLARRVVAVELDARLLPRLRSAAPGAEIIQSDILKLNLATEFPRGGEVVMGNIPYYLTGALLTKLLERPPRPRRLVLVVQREVAQRWCGIGGWSLSTVVVQTFTRPHIEFELPPQAFSPPPKVHSALVVMEVREQSAVEVVDSNAFFRFVEAVFQLRRKQLGGSLARITEYPRPEIESKLGQLGIDPVRRPQTLNLAEWERLYRMLCLPA